MVLPYRRNSTARRCYGAHQRLKGQARAASHPYEDLGRRPGRRLDPVVIPANYLERPLCGAVIDLIEDRPGRNARPWHRHDVTLLLRRAVTPMSMPRNSPAPWTEQLALFGGGESARDVATSRRRRAGVRPARFG